jgi:hypothetical protein
MVFDIIINERKEDITVNDLLKIALINKIMLLLLKTVIYAQAVFLVEKLQFSTHYLKRMSFVKIVHLKEKFYDKLTDIQFLIIIEILMFHEYGEIYSCIF